MGGSPPEGVTDYEIWRGFRNSGFAGFREFERARARGFETRRALERAERAGFDTAEDYAAFVESGAPDRETFEQKRERMNAARLAGETCLEAVSERDWPSAAPLCQQAAAVFRNDDALISARATADRQLDLMIAETEAERQRLERRLEKPRTHSASPNPILIIWHKGSAEDSDAGHAEPMRRGPMPRRSATSFHANVQTWRRPLRMRMPASNRAERGRLRATCFGEREAQRWTAAVAACTAALNADPGDDKSAENLAVAEAEREAERLRAEEERRAIALRNARRDSTQTIAALDNFAASGGAFEQGLAVTPRGRESQGRTGRRRPRSRCSRPGRRSAICLPKSVPSRASGRRAAMPSGPPRPVH